MKTEMDQKKFLVLFVAIAALFLIGSVNAVEITNSATIRAEGIDVATYTVTAGVPTTTYPNGIGVVAGDTITLKVFFVANLTGATTDSDVRVRAEIEGEKSDVSAVTEPFDMEQGKMYVKTLTVKIPSELKDTKSEDFVLNVKIWSANFRSEIENISLRAQRPSYSLDIKSITAGRTVQAGEILPIDIVLRNIGYNDLKDLYVTVKLSALNIERTAYFGDLVAIETRDDEDTVKGTFNLKVPYNAEAGIYTIEVEVKNDDTISSESATVEVTNEFAKKVFFSGKSLWIVNPTNNIEGFKIVPESPATASESIVFVPAGSSKTVEITPNTSGSNKVVVNVFTMDGKFVDTVTLSGEGLTESTEVSPVVALTIVLAIVFLVLLVILIVLVTKKPQKTEELGESYY